MAGKFSQMGINQIRETYRPAYLAITNEIDRKKCHNGKDFIDAFKMALVGSNHLKVHGIYQAKEPLLSRFSQKIEQTQSNGLMLPTPKTSYGPVIDSMLVYSDTYYSLFIQNSEIAARLQLSHFSSNVKNEISEVLSKPPNTRLDTYLIWEDIINLYLGSNEMKMCLEYEQNGTYGSNVARLSIVAANVMLKELMDSTGAERLFYQDG